MELVEALKQVDVNNDEHWTTDGLPAVAFVRELTGNEQLTRKEITDAAPELTREAGIKAQDPLPQTVADKANVPSAVDIEAEINVIDEQVADLNKRKDVLTYQRRRIAVARAGYDHKVDQQVKTDYIKASNDAKDAKAQRQKAFMMQNAGMLKPGDLDPRAKIDLAAVRRTGFGNKRVVRPLISPPPPTQ